MFRQERQAGPLQLDDPAHLLRKPIEICVFAQGRERCGEPPWGQSRV